MKEIIEVLKNKDNCLRVVNGNRWLVWDCFNSQWVVYEHTSYAKGANELIRTTSEHDAIEELLKG